MFEEYLKEVHAKNYSGTDDDMSDNFEAWLEQLDTEEIINLGNEAMVSVKEVEEVFFNEDEGVTIRPITKEDII